jgi:hypothetical protein
MLSTVNRLLPDRLSFKLECRISIFDNVQKISRPAPPTMQYFRPGKSGTYRETGREYFEDRPA